MECWRKSQRVYTGCEGDWIIRGCAASGSRNGIDSNDRVARQKLKVFELCPGMIDSAEFEGEAAAHSSGDQAGDFERVVVTNEPIVGGQDHGG